MAKVSQFGCKLVALPQHQWHVCGVKCGLEVFNISKRLIIALFKDNDIIQIHLCRLPCILLSIISRVHWNVEGVIISLKVF